MLIDDNSEEKPPTYPGTSAAPSEKVTPAKSRDEGTPHQTAGSTSKGPHPKYALFYGGSPVFFDERYILEPTAEEKTNGYASIAFFAGSVLDGKYQGKTVYAWSGLNTAGKECSSLTRIRQEKEPDYLDRLKESVRTSSNSQFLGEKTADLVQGSRPLPQGGWYFCPKLPVY